MVLLVVFLEEAEIYLDLDAEVQVEVEVGHKMGEVAVVVDHTEQELLHYPEVDFLEEEDLVEPRVVVMMDGMVVEEEDVMVEIVVDLDMVEVDQVE